MFQIKDAKFWYPKSFSYLTQHIIKMCFSNFDLKNDIFFDVICTHEIDYSLFQFKILHLILERSLFKFLWTKMKKSLSVCCIIYENFKVFQRLRHLKKQLQFCRFNLFRPWASAFSKKQHEMVLWKLAESRFVKLTFDQIYDWSNTNINWILVKINWCLNLRCKTLRNK